MSRANYDNPNEVRRVVAEFRSMARTLENRELTLRRGERVSPIRENMRRPAFSANEKRIPHHLLPDMPTLKLQHCDGRGYFKRRRNLRHRWANVLWHVSRLALACTEPPAWCFSSVVATERVTKPRVKLWKACLSFAPMQSGNADRVSSEALPSPNTRQEACVHTPEGGKRWCRCACGCGRTPCPCACASWPSCPRSFCPPFLHQLQREQQCQQVSAPRV